MTRYPSMFGGAPSAVKLPPIVQPKVPQRQSIRRDRLPLPSLPQFSEALAMRVRDHKTAVERSAAPPALVLSRRVREKVDARKARWQERDDDLFCLSSDTDEDTASQDESDYPPDFENFDDGVTSPSSPEVNSCSGDSSPLDRSYSPPLRRV